MLSTTSFKLVLMSLLNSVMLKTVNCQSSNQNANFETLRSYSGSISSSLSLECIWFVSSLFGEDDLFPPLPQLSQLNTIAFINPDFPPSFLTQGQLSAFYQNPGQARLLDESISSCEIYRDTRSSVIVFLYNLLRNYAEQRVTTLQPFQSCSNFVGIPTSSFDGECKKK